METYVNRAFLTVDGAEVSCAKLSVHTDRKVDVVDSMSRRPVAGGYRFGNYHYTLEASVNVPAGAPRPDFKQMLERARVVTAIVEMDDGRRETYVGVVVEKVADDYSADGGGPMTVSMKALDVNRR